MMRCLLLAVLPMLGFALAADRPDAVVAADGSGDFTTVQEAIAKAPMRRASAKRRPWVVFVKPGIYEERVYVQRERGNIRLVGAGMDKTEIRHHLHASLPGPDGQPIGTFATATMQIDGDGMTVENMTISNTAGPVGQALALRADGDRLSFLKCRFKGWQDTVLVNRGRHYFRDCEIEGHVDFIFGAATGFFDHCRIHCLKDGYITAASTPEGAPFGMVFADCEITAEKGAKVWLGRPWREHAQTVFLRTRMCKEIRPQGWHNWDKPDAEQSTFYAEYQCTGPGANDKERVSWRKEITAKEAAKYTPENVFAEGEKWKLEAE